MLIKSSHANSQLKSKLLHWIENARIFTDDFFPENFRYLEIYESKRLKKRTNTYPHMYAYTAKEMSDS